MINANFPFAISTTSDFLSLERFIHVLNENSLVIFDIDDVLLTATDRVLRSPHNYIWLGKYIDNNFSPSEALSLASNIWTSYKTMITDRLLPDILQKIQYKGIPIIALTAGWNGVLANRKNYCDDRIKCLKNMKIDFSQSFPQLTNIIFSTLENCSKNPSFKEGILFGCRLPKDRVLDAFLSLLGSKPDTILFIDDLRENLDDVHKYCLKNEINFYGLHYNGVEKMDNTPLDENVAHFQFQYLIKHKKWLDDIAAKNHIKYIRKNGA